MAHWNEIQRDPKALHRKQHAKWWVVAHWHKQHMQHLRAGHLNSRVSRHVRMIHFPAVGNVMVGQKNSAFLSSGGSLMVLIKDSNPGWGPIAIGKVWLLLLYRSLSRWHSPLSWTVWYRTTFQFASGNQMGAEQYFTMCLLAFGGEAAYTMPASVLEDGPLLLNSVSEMST